jgi:early secretory antigenic target protein ESAT-6
MSDLMIVNFAALQQAGGHIATAISTLRSELAELEHNAAPLVQTWEGEAKHAYEQRQTSWRQAATDLAAMLGQIKRALDESAAEYAATERRNANLFQ